MVWGQMTQHWHSRGAGMSRGTKSHVGKQNHSPHPEISLGLHPAPPHFIAVHKAGSVAGNSQSPLSLQFTIGHHPEPSVTPYCPPNQVDTLQGTFKLLYFLDSICPF